MDDEVILEYNQEWLKFDENIIKPFTKAWFLEKPERKEYLKQENIKLFKNKWVIFWLYKLEWIKDWFINNEMEEISEVLWFDIDIEMYVNIENLILDKENLQNFKQKVLFTSSGPI